MSLEETFLKLFQQVIEDPEHFPAIPLDSWSEESQEQHLLLLFRDMLDRLDQLKQDKLDTQERFSLAVQAANDGLWVQHLQTGEAYRSRRWHEMLGYEPGELPETIGEWISHLHPDDVERVLGAGRTNVATGVNNYEIEYRLRHKDGSYRWIFARTTTQRDASGRAIRLAGSNTDITLRKLAEEQLRERQEVLTIENAQLYQQAQELAATKERQRLARELHDSVSQAIYGISLGLHTARIQLDRDPQTLPQTLDYLLLLAEAALSEMRALIFELRPEALGSEGLVSALSRQATALQARYGLTIQLQLCEEPALSLSAKQGLYRIAQEAMHNTVKHACAKKIDLCLSRVAQTIVLEIRDDGVGFDPTSSFPGHLGLHSMQERVDGLGGVLQIESAPERGTCVLARVPESLSRS